jgi:putative addiction module killer protein
MVRKLVILETLDGRSPFSDWLENLNDRKARGVIRARLNRVQLGNLGDCKCVGDQVFELRVDFGPGYRVYFGQEGEYIVVLICGGDKSSQTKDIERAKQLWREYKSAS